MIWRYARKAVFALMMFGMLALSVPALALLVRPILLDLTTTGSGSNGSFEVVNDRNRAITVEIAVNRLALPERGEIKLTPDNGADFQIFPTIASIPAGGRQVFRIRWIGEPQVEQSQLFMFSTSELPVQRTVTDNLSSVQVLYAINSVVAVRSVAARPEITVENVRRATASDGRVGLDVTFSNSGAAHGYVNNAFLDLKAQGSEWTKTLQPADLNNFFGLGLVPPNAKRVMFLPVADLPASGDITAGIRPLPNRGRTGL